MDNNKDTFRGVEKVLYSYSKLKASIDDKQEYIEELKTHGLRKRSGSVIAPPQEGGVRQSQEEVIESLISTITKDIIKTELALQHIERAVNKLADDEYYEIIDMKYNQNETLETIAEYFERSVPTIHRQKNRLIEKLRMDLFTGDYLTELLRMCAKDPKA